MFRQRMQTDEVLVRRVLAGQREEYGKLVNRYLPAVFAVAYGRTGNHLDAEDIAQEAFLRALQTLDRLREPERFAPWLMTIARNISVDTIAARVRERKSGAKILSDDATWIPDMEKRDMWSKLHEQLQELDEQHREVLMLFYFAGHSAKEIAGLLNASHEAVRKRLQRARETLGARMLEELEPKKELQPLLHAQGTKIFAAAIAAPVAWQAAAGVSAGGAGGALIGGVAIKWLAGAALVCAGLAGYWVTLPNHVVESEPASIAASLPEVTQTTAGSSNAKSAEALPAMNATTAQPIAAPPDRGNGIIRGHVETANHFPIAKAHVLLHRATVDGHWVVDWTEKFRSTVSAADGSFVFEDLPFESYDVLAITGDALSWEEASVDEHNPEDTVTLLPQPAAPLRGKVVDADGSPVTGAIVYPDRQLEDRSFSCNWNRKAAVAERTDENGQFAFPALWNGQWRFNVRAEGYATQTTEYFPTGRDDATIVIDRGSAIRGTVVHVDTGEPIAGVQVDYFGAQEWDKRTTTTDAGGRFVFTCVEPGDRGVRLNDAHWAPVGGATPLTVPADRAAENVFIRAAEGATVSGRIYDADIEQGVPGVKVSVECRDIGDYRSSEPSNANGFYTITGLAAGAYTVRRGRFVDGYPFPEEPWDPELTLVFGQRVTHDILMSRGLAVSGRVVDTEGSPIRGVGLMTMVTSDRHQYGHSKADGSFTLMGYRTGDDVTINAEKDGYALALSGPIPIRDGDVSGVEIVMELEAFVDGVVVDDSGRPLPHAEILARAETKREGNIPTATSGPDGRFICGKLGTGSYAFSVQPHDADRSVETDTVVFVTGGERIEGIRIVCPSSNDDTQYRISGRVIGVDGNSIAGVTVRGENYIAESHQSVKSNGEGKFELTGLAYLRYNLQAISEDRQLLGETDGVPAGTSGVEIVAAKPARIAGEIVGIVVRADTGAPIADFDVNPASKVVPVHDPQGRFHLRDVHVGQVPISVRANGYIDGFVVATVKPLDEGPTEVTMRMQPAARLNGIVRDTSGTPVQGARIFAGGLPSTEEEERFPTVESGEDGSFVLDNLDPRGALVAIKHPSYAPLVERVVPSEWVSRGHVFTLSSGGAVVGSVTYDGEPAPDSLVWVYLADLGNGPTFNGRTGPDGTYRIDGIPPGTGTGGARLASELAGLDTNEFHQKQQVSVREGEVTRMDFEFLPHTAALEGVVTVNGRPADAVVRLFAQTPAGEQQMETFADLSGVYRFDAVPPGEAMLKVEVWTGSAADGSRSAMVPVTLTSGSASRQDVALTPGASAIIRVANRRDDETLSVAAYFGDVGPIETRSDTEAAWSAHVASLQGGENGEFRLDNLQPGIYTLVARTNISQNGNVWINTRAAHQVIEIEDGVEAAVDLRLP